MSVLASSPAMASAAVSTSTAAMSEPTMSEPGMSGREGMRGRVGTFGDAAMPHALPGWVACI